MNAGPHDLLHRFANPGAEFSPLPLWWWSGSPVTRERLRWQMEQLVEQGVRQAVVMCLAPTGPLFGSVADDPPFLSPRWIELLDGACEDAQRLGFHIWMYDQIGFSGANFQGRLTAANPGFAGLALARRPDGVIEERVSGFDYFGVEACAALLDQVHGELERQVGHWFGTVIPGFFQDELPALPTWGHDFADSFAERYGYDLRPHLASLFAGDDPDSARVRRDYHEHRARLARRAFFDPLAAWFGRHGMICGFDQRTPAREGDPVGGVQVYGDYLDTHSGFGAPGSDHWGDAKLHSSLAHAHGHGRTWLEAFHSSGWGGTLEETYDWLAPFLRRGATLYDPHAVYYSTVGGWWEWAPPSTCWRQPYWPSYHVFATAVARLCAVLTAGSHVCDTVLLSPTTTAQAYLTLDGPLPPASEAGARYHDLNGVNSWCAEKRGVLERAGVDHDVLDEATVATATIDAAGLHVADETYRTVLVPGARALHTAAARTLLDFAEAGGRVVCVDRAPDVFLGDEPAAGTAFTGAVANGDILVVPAVQVPEAVATGPVRVRADAPVLVRRHGSAHVLMITAHDESTGTQAPIVTWPDIDWTTEGLAWDQYWQQLRDVGYRFVPAGDRIAHVRIEGLPPQRAQRWSPGTGRRAELDVTGQPDGSWSFEVPFADGPIALVVLADELPEPDDEPPGEVVEAVPVDGPWRGLATSTLDNRWGDLASPQRPGVLPIEVWRLDHVVTGGDVPAADADWQPVTASYGPFAEVRDGNGPWRPAHWSLSRGIRDDAAHQDTLGPKGYVPEEFLDWRRVAAGERVAVRTHLTVPDRTGLHLAVGANAERRVIVDDVELPVEGDGYQSFSPLPTTLAGRTVPLRIELRAEQDGPVRASFAVVGDIPSYRRPEWLSAGDDGRPGRQAQLRTRITLDAVPDDARIQVASDGACHVLVNGVEVGRQGDFNPYPGHREIRVHPYHVGDELRAGENVIELRTIDDGPQPTAVALDSTPRHLGGLGLTSGPGWEAGRDGVWGRARVLRRQSRDPRFVCLHARPHPLHQADWLDAAAAPGDVVARVVPDVAPGTGRTEWLRLAAPLGATAFRIPTSLDVTVIVAGQDHRPVDGEVRMPAPLAAGTPVLLRVRARDGRRGGALLDAAIEVDVAEAEVRLVSWEELGLRALGGQVRYRTTVHVDGTIEPRRTVLDLGEVRGTADVVVNGTLTDRLVWGPWRSDVTNALRPGANEIDIVVRGTLAGYLDDASPTAAVVAGQVRTGLFGPVRLLHHRRTATTSGAPINLSDSGDSP